MKSERRGEQPRKRRFRRAESVDVNAEALVSGLHICFGAVANPMMHGNGSGCHRKKPQQQSGDGKQTQQIAAVAAAAPAVKQLGNMGGGDTYLHELDSIK